MENASGEDKEDEMSEVVICFKIWRLRCWCLFRYDLVSYYCIQVTYTTVSPVKTVENILGEDKEVEMSVVVICLSIYES